MKKTIFRSAVAMFAVVLMLVSMMPTAVFAASETTIELFGGKNEVCLALYGYVSTYDYTATPDEAYEETITWTVGDESVLSVITENYGYGYVETYIQAIGVGSTTLTATLASGASDTVTVTVTAPIVWNGEKTQTILMNQQFMERVFAFTPAETAAYSVYSTGSNGGADLGLLDENGEYLASAEYNMGMTDFSLTYDFEAGKTYYFYLSSYEVYFTGGAAFEMTVCKTEETAEVAFDWDSLLMSVGDMAYPTYSFLPLGSVAEEVTITSSDESVVIVEYGVLTAVGTGNATVTVCSESGLTDELLVSVGEVRLLNTEERTLLDFPHEMYMESYAFIAPASGKYVFRSYGEGDIYGELYDSNGEVIAYPEEYFGDFALTAALQQGEVYVLQVSYGGQMDSAAITVAKEAAATTMELFVYDDYCAKISGDIYYVYKDSVLMLGTEFGDALGAAPEEVTYTVSDPSVAEVYEGVVYGLDSGTVTVTATSQSGLTDSVTVCVIDYIPADVNMDGILDMFDALAVYQAVSGGTTLGEANTAIADYNGDNTFDMFDALAVYSRVSGQ